MSDNHKKPSQLLVLPKTPSQQPLMVMQRRLLLRGVLFVMSFIFIAGFLWQPKRDFLHDYQQVTAKDNAIANANPPLSTDINTLKGQFVGLVSGSIEGKLRTLEESLKTGAVTHSLGTIEELKTDVKMLRLYAEPVNSTPQTTANPVSTVQLMQEMSQLKRLIYWTFASCGLMLAAVAGVWLRHLKKLPSKETIVRYLSR